MRLRFPRFAVLAALLAAILAFVAVGHAGSHLGGVADSGIACGICADPATEAPAGSDVVHALVAIADVVAATSAGALRSIDAAHAPRGPPVVCA